MKKKFIGAIALAIAVAGSATSAAQPLSRTSDPDIQAIAAEAYVFGYPLVSMYITKRVMTNVTAPQKNGHAPPNQVGNFFTYPTAAFKDVTAPNVNTLYSSMWLDLSKEPIVVHMPDTHDRYYVMEVLDFWTNVIASPGKRTTGTSAQDIAFIGPNWNGQLPAGIQHNYRSPTNVIWVLNRIQANGPKDYPVVNALQRQITTAPLSSFGKPHTWPMGTVDPSIDTKTAVKDQVNKMPADVYFSTMAKAMMDNRPVAADSAIVARMTQIGLKPGSEFAMNPATTADIRAGAKKGLEEIEKGVKTVARMENGWMLLTNCGQYGTKYLTRAVVALIGLGCNLPQDAFYPTTAVDATGKTLNGAHNYVVHFPAGQEPPVDAFWSITMYDKDYFLVENPINRSAISSWGDLKKNPDGSVDIVVQRESPGVAKESNWLPAPAGDFVLMMRLYWPKENAISGMWKLPAVTMQPH